MNSLNKVSASSVLLAGLPTTLCADVLFYGGDIGPESTFQVNSSPSGSYALIYEVFELSERTAITALFTHQIAKAAPVQGEYEIRTGVTEGYGGHLVAAGSSIPEFLPTGRKHPLGFLEYRYTIRFTPVILDAGVYAFNINGRDSTFVGTTNGLNGTGTTVGDNRSFGLSIFTQWNWTNLQADYSMGVEGHAVPEPITLLGMGVPVMIALLKRKRESCE